MMLIPGTVSTHDLSVKLAHAFVAIVDMVAEEMGSACVCHLPLVRTTCTH